MLAPKIIDGVPTFTELCFPRPQDKVYIHMSSEFPDFVGIPHSHKFIEVVYIISGSAEHVVGNSRFIAKKGDIFVINPDVNHAFYEQEDNPESFCDYDLMFVPNFFDLSLINGGDFTSLGASFLFYTMFPQEKAANADLHVSSTSYNDFGDLFRKIYQEYHTQEQGYLNIIRAYIIELIVKIFRRMDCSSEVTESIHKSKIINETLDYLHKNYSMRISVADLASQMFVSRNYFSKLFRQTTGMSVSTFLKQLRINEACRLLMETDRSISDIASYCGFQDMKHFYVAFRSQTGMPPGEYRKCKQ